MNTLKTFFVLASLLLLFLSPNPVSAQSSDHCTSATTLQECAGMRDCNWDADNTPHCVPNYVYRAEYGDKVSDILINNPDIDPLKGKFTSLSSVINDLLPYLLTLAGLILFGMLIWGGFTMLTATTDPKKAEAGKQRITSAIVGFIIIFTAYWLTQILEIILGVKIL